jgi:malonyl-CoA O-methyltransferase
MSGSVAQQFSRAAESYERGAGLHRHVAARLVEMLPEPDGSEAWRILEVGCGTGVLTDLIRRRYPEATLCAIDVAAGMTRYLREMHPNDKLLECVVADARTFASDRPFDLVVSSSSLHWAAPLSETMANLGRLTRAGRRLVAAVMVEHTLRELHALRRTIAPDKVPLARLAGANEVVEVVARSGFVVREKALETVQTRYRSADDFLRTIHAQGLTGGEVSRAAQLLNRSELRRLIDAYDQSYRDLHGGVYASFEVLYLDAVRG